MAGEEGGSPADGHRRGLRPAAGWHRAPHYRRGPPLGLDGADGFDLFRNHEHFGGYSYTAYVLAPGALGPLADHLHGFLSGLPGTLASASAPSPGLCVVRILTTGAPELYGALNGVRPLVRESFGLPGLARAVV